MAGKLRVVERRGDMVLAEHYTRVHGGRHTAATLETVTFDRPHRIGLRLVRGPVPHVAEEFRLTGQGAATIIEYTGELGTDFGTAGQWWATRVAAAWEAAVATPSTASRPKPNGARAPAVSNATTTPARAQPRR